MMDDSRLEILTIRMAQGIGNNLDADLSFLGRSHKDGLGSDFVHFPCNSLIDDDIDVVMLMLMMVDDVDQVW